MSTVFSAAPEPKPKGILEPSCACAAPVEVRKPNRLKEAFLAPKPPGSLAKKTSTPLGKSYRRKVPLQQLQNGAGLSAIHGPPVLATDPRTTATNAPPAFPSSHRGSAVSAVSDGSLQESVATYSSRSTAASSTDLDTPRGDSGAGSSSVSPERRFASTSTASTSESVSSTNTSTSIRFCPLPSTGRAKARAQSISIGVASRAQLLNTQGGAGPHQSQQALQALQMSHRAPPPPALPDDVVDIGEVMHKGVRKIMRRLRKDQPAGSSTSSNDDGAMQTKATAGRGGSGKGAEQPIARSQSINVAQLEHHPASDVRLQFASESRGLTEFAVADDDDDDEEDSVEIMNEARARARSSSPAPPRVLTARQGWVCPDPFKDADQDREEGDDDDGSSRRPPLAGVMGASEDKAPLESGYGSTSGVLAA